MQAEGFGVTGRARRGSLGWELPTEPRKPPQHPPICPHHGAQPNGFPRRSWSQPLASGQARLSVRFLSLISVSATGSGPDRCGDPGAGRGALMEVLWAGRNACAKGVVLGDPKRGNF